MADEQEHYDDDDTVFGDWSGVVPWKMKHWTEHKLQQAHVLGNDKHTRFVESELFRRRNVELKNRIGELQGATNDVRDATLGVETQVSKLAASSETLEALTRKLITLTNWLIILTVAAVIVPIGIEIWKATLLEKSVPIVVQLLKRRRHKRHLSSPCNLIQKRVLVRWHPLNRGPHLDSKTGWIAI